MLPDIPGLRYVPDYLDQDAHDRLIAAADAEEWRSLGERRVQAHGYSYDSTKGGVYRLGELPAWAQAVATDLQRHGLIPDVADQMIVNEYQPGSGIPAHVDATFFGDTIVSLSLGSTCVIVFDDDRNERHEELLVEPRSALVMTLDARHTWKHGIRARHSDTWEGRERARGRRLSLTFRTMRSRPCHA